MHTASPLGLVCHMSVVPFGLMFIECIINSAASDQLRILRGMNR